MQARAPKLFVGVGNVLCRDDGVGVRAAQVMARLALPRDVEVYEAGTTGLAVASTLERRERVVVVDAIDAGAEPGAVFRLRPEDLRPCVNTALSLHQTHLLDALEETRLLGTAPNEVTVFAVQVGDVATGLDLSPAVEASLAKVLRLAIRELGLAPTILAGADLAPSPWGP